MSRQSKNAKNKARAKQFSEIRKGGGKGPSKTQPLHGKKNTKWNHPETIKARAAVLGKSHASQEEKSVLEKMNEKKERKANNQRRNQNVVVNSETTNKIVEAEVEALKTAEE